MDSEASTEPTPARAHIEQDHYEAVVIGGGQAGLATAFYLLRAGVDTLVLDDQPAAGGAWRHVWPSLQLFSTAGFSNLPGMPMPACRGFPPATHVVDYLSAYERRYRVPVERPVGVARVEHHDRIFYIDAEPLSGTGAGTRSWTATNVIAATGTWSAPFVPSYPGTFTGTQWHSATTPAPSRSGEARSRWWARPTPGHRSPLS